MNKMEDIYAGVLEIANGATFGRQKRANGKEGKLYYGITHLYKDLPPVKVPFELKKNECLRYYKDKYVLFKLTKHQFQLHERPEALLVETLGDTDDVDAFSKYIAFEKGFYLSSSWNKEFSSFSLNKKETIDNILVKSQTYHCQTSQKNIIEIFTIDPEGCCDMDDGMGIRAYKDQITNDDMFDLYIAITCVPSFILATNMTSNQLISSLKNTCSLYLANHVINMMPKQFAEKVCSLNKLDVKPALVLTITWNNTIKKIISKKLDFEKIRVLRNDHYDNDELLNYKPYQELYACANDILMNGYKFDTCNEINDSHTMVAYLMTFMNYYVMEWLEERNLPCIYRLNIKKSNTFDLPDHIKKIERKLGYYTGLYSTHKHYDHLENKTENMVIWTHITSPMRRLADLTNMITILLYLYEEQYKELREFRDYSLMIVDRINHEYKQSRRVSLDCELFNLVKQESDSLLTKTFTAIVIECEKLEENKYDILVYVDELSRLFNVKHEQTISLYSTVHCKIIVFDEKQKLRDKVRLIICH